MNTCSFDVNRQSEELPGIEDFEAKEQVWVVTAVDHDPDGMCDGKARVLGVYKNEIDAKLYVKADMEHWMKSYSDENVDCDFERYSAWDKTDCMFGCEWNITSAEVK